MGPSDSLPVAARSRAATAPASRLGAGASALLGVALLVAGVSWPIALAIGAVGVAGALALGRRVTSAPRPARMDPFEVGEPWRRFVQGAQRSAQRLHDTVDAAPEGPLRDRMTSIAGRLDRALEETWAIARRGHQLDATIRHLDPTGLRAKRDALAARRAEAEAGAGGTVGEAGVDGAGTGDLDAALASLDDQLAATERLRAESERTADRLRLTQARLDELVSRAAEVGAGAGDTDTYAHDVDDLVVELEGLRLAVEETNRPGTP